MDETTLYRKRKRPAEAFLLSAVYGAASVSVMLLCGMIGYLFFRGAGAVSWRFLTTVTDVAKKTSGIAGNMINTLYIAALTLLAAIPLGVGAAVYLSEYAKPGKLVNLIVFTTETLAGIPSVLFGLFGMGFFGETLGLGYSLLTGALTLALMVLPLIVRNTQEALRLPKRRAGAGSFPFLYDPHRSFARGHAGHSDGGAPFGGTHCGRIRGASVHGRQRRPSAEAGRECVWHDPESGRKNAGIGRDAGRGTVSAGSER